MVHVQLNDRGPRVVAAQTRMNRFADDLFLQVDGIFGEQTAEAVRRIQNEFGFHAVTGILNLDTWRRLTDALLIFVLSLILEKWRFHPSRPALYSPLESHRNRLPSLINHV